MEIYFNERANDLLISENDKLNFQVDIKARRSRVVLDFDKLINKNDEGQNLLLEDRDVIYINDNKNIVYVYGQVNNEGYVPFNSGKDYEYYIEKSGGYSLAADKGNTRIIKFSTRGWYKTDQVNVENGDFIYVPKKDIKMFSETITIISQIAGVMLGIITTYILIKNTSK
jgi:protein involved in polysaccharide export with SLBB domain